ncbi:MAG: hypothetical protein VX424_14065 [Actinomycetota bacterium]|nr:hypothetical protein [Actinomycetota bacterium]
MRKVRPEEIGATDLGTWMQGPEQVFIAIAVQPPNDTQLITAHRTLEGAKRQVESYGSGTKGSVKQVPLQP